VATRWRILSKSLDQSVRFSALMMKTKYLSSKVIMIESKNLLCIHFNNTPLALRTMPSSSRVTPRPPAATLLPAPLRQNEPVSLLGRRDWITMSGGSVYYHGKRDSAGAEIMSNISSTHNRRDSRNEILGTRFLVFLCQFLVFSAFFTFGYSKMPLFLVKKFGFIQFLVLRSKKFRIAPTITVTTSRICKLLIFGCFAF